MKTYYTHEEAIEREIIEPIEAGGRDVASREQFDIDEIAHEVISLCFVGEYRTPKYRLTVDEDEFWEIAEKFRKG